LNDEDGRVAHILSDTHARLAIGEGPDLSGHKRDLQFAGQFLGQGRVGVAGYEHQWNSGGWRHAGSLRINPGRP
jgi:hypothetical protein